MNFCLNYIAKISMTTVRNQIVKLRAMCAGLHKGVNKRMYGS